MGLDNLIKVNYEYEENKRKGGMPWVVDIIKEEELWLDPRNA